MNIVYEDLHELLSCIEELNPEVIVVEGYNGVGKSRIIEAIKRRWNISVYRPSYDNWARRLPSEYRWTIFSSFFDVINQYDLPIDKPILFDRGMITGAVYNHDFSICDYYKYVVGDRRVLQILVTCDKESYDSFLKVRGSVKDLSYDLCRESTDTYREALAISGANFIEFKNIYDERLGIINSCTCRGCGHYNVGDSYCKHPSVLKEVSPSNSRCKYSEEKEVQDLVRELHELPSM